MAKQLESLAQWQFELVRPLLNLLTALILVHDAIHQYPRCVRAPPARGLLDLSPTCGQRPSFFEPIVSGRNQSPTPEHSTLLALDLGHSVAATVAFVAQYKAWLRELTGPVAVAFPPIYSN